MFDHDPQPPAGGDDRFRLAMAASGIGMGILGLDGRWLEVNPALEKMLGFAPGQLVGVSSQAITHPEDVAVVDAWLGGFDAGRQVLDLRKRYLHRDGHVVHVEINAAAMPGPGGEPLYLVVQVRDATAEHEARQAQAAWTASLEASIAERTAALDRLARQEELFAYGVSHDLRAPLRTIESFSALLASRHGAALDDEGRDHLARIRAAAVRMGGLIDALLELSRVSRDEYRDEVVDLSLLADWVGAELQDADPGRAAAITVQPDLLARGDERRLKIVLDHLLGNAWKFSAGRERVEIAIDGERRGDRLHLRVRDRGSGFDMRYARQLFEPFQRLHGADDGGGHGLGLAIAERIVERHGGRMHAESAAGEGSTFHVELPAADPA